MMRNLIAPTLNAANQDTAGRSSVRAEEIGLPRGFSYSVMIMRG